MSNRDPLLMDGPELIRYALKRAAELLPKEGNVFERALASYEGEQNAIGLFRENVRRDRESREAAEDRRPWNETDTGWRPGDG